MRARIWCFREDYRQFSCIHTLAGKKTDNWTHMDAIITQWNREWVSGRGGAVFLMRKPNEACCVVVCPMQEKENAWVTFGSRETLATELDRSIFLQSMSVCRVERIFTAPLLTCVYRCEMSVVTASFFPFPARRLTRDADAALVFDTSKSLWDLWVRVLIFSPHPSSCVTLS